MKSGQTAYQQKTNLCVQGLPNDITELQVRMMFEEFGTIRSVLLKSPVPQNEMTKHITSLLPIYSMAYVNFENEDGAQGAFAINKRDPMSQIKVAYYVKGQSGSMAVNPHDSTVRGNTNYRIIFITKLNRKVSIQKLRVFWAL